MKVVLKTAGKLDLDTETEVIRLTAMAKLLRIALRGDFEASARNGFVTICEDDREALLWICSEICSEIEKLDEAFYADVAEKAGAESR